MRPLALFLAVALSGCSLIRTSSPSPLPTWTRRSDCNDSAAPPIIDGVVAGVGGLAVAGGAAQFAQGTDARGNSTAGSGLLAIGAGVVGIGLFATSAIIGARRISACSAALAEWDQAHPNDPDRPRPGEGRLEVAARAYLNCPVGELVNEGISFGRNNKWADNYRWGEHQISGCGKMTWCAERDGRLGCEPPPDLALAAQQVSVESGCPAQSVQQLQRFGVAAKEGRHELSGQSTYRLDACGQQYTCTVPLYAPYDNETLVPVLGERQLGCRPVIAGVPIGPTGPVPPSPPPPPPGAPDANP